MVTRGGNIRIGISGWRYEPWRGVFYPKGMVHKRELAFASQRFSTIEINGTFYSLQQPASYRAWHDQTPPGFVFAVKGPKFITHMRRLKDIAVPLANFYASGVLALKTKLGPMLWQFPPHLQYDEQRFDAFFRLLPRDTTAALTLARQHDARLDGRCWLEVDGHRPLRHAVEVRHDSFRSRDFIILLRRHRIALVVADTAGRWPLLEDLTSDFVYMRLHGDKELYASGYGEEALAFWADRINTWSRGGQAADSRLASADSRGRRRAHRDVFCYFDNDVKVHAPYDAARLAARLGQPVVLDDAEGFVPDADAPPPRRHAPGFGRAQAFGRAGSPASRTHRNAS